MQANIMVYKELVRQNKHHAAEFAAVVAAVTSVASSSLKAPSRLIVGLASLSYDKLCKPSQLAWKLSIRIPSLARPELTLGSRRVPRMHRVGDRAYLSMGVLQPLMGTEPVVLTCLGVLDELAA